MDAQASTPKGVFSRKSAAATTRSRHPRWSNSQGTWTSPCKANFLPFVHTSGRSTANEPGELGNVRGLSVPVASPMLVSAYGSPGLSRETKQRKVISKQQSLLIAIKNYKLPTRYPERFATFDQYKNKKGDTIPLLHRDTVARVLMDLDRDVQPLLTEFQVFYSALSEAHPKWLRAAYTTRIPLNFEPCVKAFAHHIQLRVRNRTAPNDVGLFYNRSTLCAVLFHELAHIRHMDHGEEFMFFLRDIYKAATRRGIFRPGESHQLPSCRVWENRLFATAGNVWDYELREMKDT